MLFKIIFLVSLTLFAAMAEQPSNTFGPYAASGFRPSSPFNFPRDRDFRPELAKQQRQPSRPAQSQVDYDVTKARVDFVGQIQDNVFIPNDRKPQKVYSTPNIPSPDFLKMQDLPLETILQQFYNPSSVQGQPPLQPLQPQQNFFGQSNGQQQFFPRPQRPQNKPNNNNQQSPQSPPQHVPADKYGPPQTLDFNIIYPDPEPRNFESSANGGDVEDYEPDDTDTDKRNEYVRAKQGQYFVLGPDNTIQRVVFTTTQDEEDKRTNGFTAQLKYMPVGELRDPVFKYNNRGQLVRVLKK